MDCELSRGRWIGIGTEVPTVGFRGESMPTPVSGKGRQTQPPCLGGILIRQFTHQVLASGR
jgi:hypothetical protein